MQNDIILDKLNSEITSVTPDNFEQIKEKCTNKNQNSKETLFMKNPNKKSSVIKKIAAIAAAIAVVVCAAAVALNLNPKVDSVIGIDVNPSIEIRTDKDEEVISVSALNDDAAKIIEGMDFEGVDLNVTVNAVIGSMVRNGYITDLQNSVLVSVNNDDPEKQQKLLEDITKDINVILDESKIDGAVLSQAISDSADVAALAKEYGISEGKASLISLVSKNSDKNDFASLKDLSITELVLMGISDSTDSESKINIEGEASTKAYITQEKAEEIVLADCGLKNTEVTSLVCEFESDDGIMIYDIEFVSKGKEYSYEVNAISGKIIGKEIEKPDVTVPTVEKETAAASNEYIGETKAIETALLHAGISKKSASNTKCKLENDDGVIIYEVEFDSGKYEYDYEINAKTGKVIAYNKEYNDDYVPSSGTNKPTASTTKPVEPATNAPSSGSSSGTYIGEAKAKEIALKKVGVKAGSISAYKCKLDRDDGVYVYEIEFRSGNYEYDFEINAKTGKIIGYDRDYEAKPAVKVPETTNPPQSSSGRISESKAKEIAISKAGVNSKSISDYRIKLDRDDGIYVYDIDFRSGNYEYSIEINATTGRVIDYDKEYEPLPENSGNSNGYITSDDAKRAALNHAGLSQQDVKGLKAEFDKEGPRAVYEVEFRAGMYDFEYEINAETGKVLKFDKEIDD